MYVITPLSQCISECMLAVDCLERTAWTSEQGLKNEGNATFVVLDDDDGTATLTTLAIRAAVPSFVESIFGLSIAKCFVYDILAADFRRLRTVAVQNKRALVAKGLPIGTDAAIIAEEALRVLQEKSQ